MKHTQYILILLLSIIFLSCRKEDNEPEITERTVFMYLPWSTNLTSYFYDNITDLEKAIAEKGLEQEKVIVFMSTSALEAEMFEIVYNKGICKRNILKEYSNPQFTTETGLTDIISDMKSFAPAESYSMIIGCHGMGWLPVDYSSSRTKETFKYHWEYTERPMTRFFGGLSAEYQTDIATLAKSISNNDIKMEYIMFDDCYMSNIEVAYDLRYVTNHIIACPTEIMAYGMPYALIGKYLLDKNPDYQSICNEFYSFYSTYKYPYGTIGITDCRELDNMASIMKIINSIFSFDSSKEELIQPMDGYSPTIFYDFADYVKNLCGENDDTYAAFTEILDKVVPYKAHTEKFYSASSINPIPISTYCGITTSEPSYNKKANSYTETSWYKATH